LRSFIEVFARTNTFAAPTGRLSEVAKPMEIRQSRRRAAGRIRVAERSHVDPRSGVCPAVAGPGAETGVHTGGADGFDGAFVPSAATIGETGPRRSAAWNSVRNGGSPLDSVGGGWTARSTGPSSAKAGTLDGDGGLGIALLCAAATALTGAGTTFDAVVPAATCIVGGTPLAPT
jgi:hypothetical protein